MKSRHPNLGFGGVICDKIVWISESCLKTSFQTSTALDNPLTYHDSRLQTNKRFQRKIHENYISKNNFPL